MTAAQLAIRLNVSQPRVFALEKSEVDAEIAAERERIVNEMLKGNLRGLWDEA